MESIFQPVDACWDDYAAREGLRSVLDPEDAAGVKNAGIDLLHRLALNRALGRRRFQHVVDFGCGTGRLGDHLARRADRVIGVDPTAAMLARAAADRRRPNIDHLRFDGLRLPLPDASADLVVSVYVLQYAVRERSVYRSLVAELARVLAPGGLLVCIEQASAGAEGSGSVERAVRPRDYLEPASARFEQLAIRPVRLGSAGRFERRTLLRTGMPRLLRRLAARAVLRRNARLDASELSEQPYVDWLFRLVRRS